MRIIGSSLTHNDLTKGWIKSWLQQNSSELDEWIVLDDCSDDGTFEYLKEFKENNNNDCKIHIARTQEPTFKTQENKIRCMLWNRVREIARPGDYIIVLDSDEVMDFNRENIVEIIEKNPNKRYLLRKLEFWEPYLYRHDGLWSNFFERIFPYKDEDWGYYEKGFHFPQIPKYTQELELYNTLLPVMHLAYDNEFRRDEKLNFMINNPQQNKDINYYHLLTIKDKEPLVKNAKNYNPNKIVFKNIILDMSDSFCIDNKFITFLEENKRHYYLHLILDNSNVFIEEQIKFLSEQKSLSHVDFIVHNFYNCKNSLGILLNEMKFYKDDYTLYINGSKNFEEYTLKIMNSMDKNITFHRYGDFILMKDLYLQIMKKTELKESHRDLFKNIFRFRKMELMWLVDYNFNPFPMNSEIIIKNTNI